MTILLVEIWNTAPALLAAVLLPFVFYYIYLFYFSIRYDKNTLEKFSRALDMVSLAAERLEPREKKNLALLNDLLPENAPKPFMTAWQKMHEQANFLYTEDILPEARVYFKEEQLIKIPSNRSTVKSLLALALSLAAFSALIPFLWDTAAGGALTEELLWIGLLAAMAIILGHLFFALIDAASYQRAKTAYQRFLVAFDRALPTADSMAVPALLIDATKKNQKAFIETVEFMSKSFENNTNELKKSIDEFANGGVLPALDSGIQKMLNNFLVPAIERLDSNVEQTLRKITDKQEAGVKELTDSFAARLADTLQVRMNALAENLDRYQERMAEMNSLSDVRLGEINRQFESYIAASDELHEKNQKLFDDSAEALSNAVSLQTVIAESGAKLSTTSEELSATMLRFQEQGEAMGRESLENTKQNSQIQIAMAEDMKQAQLKFQETLKGSMEQYAKLEQMIDGLMAGIMNQMNEALAGAGREIGYSINKTTGENAQAIADLALQSHNLREDYEAYFSRVDDSTKKILDEMDYQLQGMVSRITDEVGIMLKSAAEENGSILSQYKDQTVGLLQSFEEQSLNISLYAKEINMDIAELSANLKEAVGEFTENIKEGVHTSISEFDRGLAELAERMANAVEGISDAVEHLPAAIRGGHDR